MQIFLEAAIRPDARIGFHALEAEAVLHGDVDRAAERVQPVKRVAGDHGDAVDRRGGDEIPVHRVAKNLVDANAVLIDGEPLRHAFNRRGREAAKLDIGLELIAVDVVDDRARHVLLDRLFDRRRSAALDLAARDLADGAWNLIEGNFAALDGRHRHALREMRRSGGFGSAFGGGLQAPARRQAGPRAGPPSQEPLPAVLAAGSRAASPVSCGRGPRGVTLTGGNWVTPGCCRRLGRLRLAGCACAGAGCASGARRLGDNNPVEDPIEY